LNKTSTSEATWALLVEGVSAARLQAHRLQHLTDRAQAIIEASDECEHIYEVAGDIIQGAPDRLRDLTRVLDRLGYALAKIGEDNLREHLSADDRFLVDSALEGRKDPTLLQPMANRLALRHLATDRVARRYLADLNPQLGWPGGPCHVVERIENEVRDPKVRSELIEDVELGDEIDNSEANIIYDMTDEKGAGMFPKLQLTPHVQYRMDQRNITTSDLRATFMEFTTLYKRGAQFFNQPSVKKQKLLTLKSQALTWREQMQRRRKILFVSSVRLAVVFVVQGQTARLITAYWEGLADPRPPGDGACQIA
jgi:hypothetical protein